MKTGEIKKILIPLTEDQFISDRYSPILNMAEQSGAEVTLTMVITDLKASRENIGKFSSYQLLALVEEESKKRLTLFKEELEQDYKNIEFKLEVTSGTPFIKLVELAHARKIDLIALDSLHDGIRNHPTFGSTAKHLMRKSNVPVWAVSTNSAANISKIVAAVDVASPNTEGKELNKNILLYSQHLAKTFNADLTILHAWTLYGESYLRTWERKSELEIALLVREEKGVREKALENLIDETIGEVGDIKVLLHEGKPESVIPDHVHNSESDILVMGSVCRTGIPGFFIGNTAESILDIVNCSVITLKPSGFHSPVIPNTLSEAVKES